MKLRNLPAILMIVALTASNLGSSGSGESPLTALPGQPVATAIPPSLPQESPDVIFHNGVILTMNRDQPTAEAIAVRDQPALIWK
jgi:hypothetical protein